MTLPEHTRQPLGPNQERWIQALESGEYTQAHGWLRRRDAFCCLGVACELVGVAGHELEGRDWWGYGVQEVTTEAPAQVVDHLALNDRFGGGNGGERSLVDLNDGRPIELVEPKSFSEIAAIIRADPSIYFKEPR